MSRLYGISPEPTLWSGCAGTAKWGWFNAGGIQGSPEEVLESIRGSRLPFLVPGETWLRPVGSLKHPAIVIDHHHPREEFSKGRGFMGLWSCGTFN